IAAAISRTPVLFRLGKQPPNLYPPVPKPKLFGSIPIGINETSYPSTLFYLDGWLRTKPIGTTIADTDDLAPLKPGPSGLTIVTRPGRLTEADQRKLGHVQARPDLSDAQVSVYDVQPVGNAH